MPRHLPALFACILGCPSVPALAENVTIRTTAHGIPHIEAASHHGLG